MRLGPLAVASLGLSVAARADPAHLGLRVELGAEYDTNPGRLEEVQGSASAPIAGSPLGRFVTAADVAATVGVHSLALSAGLAGKGFTRSAAEREDVLVAESSAGWTVRAAGRTSVGLSGAYYDVFQRSGVTALDFRSLGPALRLEQGLGSGGLL